MQIRRSVIIIKQLWPAELARIIWVYEVQSSVKYNFCCTFSLSTIDSFFSLSGGGPLYYLILSLNNDVDTPPLPPMAQVSSQNIFEMSAGPGTRSEVSSLCQ